MLHRTLFGVFSIVAVLTLVSGCVGVPGLRGAASAPTPVAMKEINELSGTWSGTLGWVGAYFYEGEGWVTLDIKPDGTFTGKVTPNRGANNLTKASTWSGTVAVEGDLVTLRNTTGPWTWLTFRRWGDHTLYAAVNDPSMQANMMLTVDRDRSRAQNTAQSQP